MAMRRTDIAYNNTIHKSTGYTPLEIVFGENFGRRGASLTESNHSIGKFRMDRQRETRCTNAKVQNRLESEKRKRTEKINLKKGEIFWD